MNKKSAHLHFNCQNILEFVFSMKMGANFMNKNKTYDVRFYGTMISTPSMLVVVMMVVV